LIVMSSAFTPGAFSAAAASMLLTRACACGDRRNAAVDQPRGRTMSYEYLARPDALSGPSMRDTRVLEQSCLLGHGIFFVLRRTRGRLHFRVLDQPTAHHLG
jgi:hypothetical protein